MFVLPDFQVSKTIVLTECYLINHWWIAIIQAMGPNIFQWLTKIEERSYLYTTMLLKTIDIWFVKAPRKPPDPAKKMLNATQSWFDYAIKIGYILEDSLYTMFKIDIDLHFWSCIIKNITHHYALRLVQLFIEIDINTSDSKTIDTNHDWKANYFKQITVTEMNKPHPSSYFKYRKLIMSNVVMSMTAKSKSAIDATLLMDTDSYLFAIDTCTSETICKHKELFIGKIKNCKNVYVQGVANDWCQ